jgi:hypothetical protein
VSNERELIDKINVISDDFAFCEELRIIAFKFFRSLELKGKYYRRIGESKLQTIEHSWTNFMYLFKYKKLVNSSIKPCPRKNKLGLCLSILPDGRIKTFLGKPS